MGNSNDAMGMMNQMMNMNNMGMSMGQGQGVNGQQIKQKIEDDGTDDGQMMQGGQMMGLGHGGQQGNPMMSPMMMQNMMQMMGMGGGMQQR